MNPWWKQLFNYSYSFVDCNYEIAPIVCFWIINIFFLCMFKMWSRRLDIMRLPTSASLFFSSLSICLSGLVPFSASPSSHSASLHHHGIECGSFKGGSRFGLVWSISRAGLMRNNQTWQLLPLIFVWSKTTEKLCLDSAEVLHWMDSGVPAAL